MPEILFLRQRKDIAVAACAVCAGAVGSALVLYGHHELGFSFLVVLLLFLVLLGLEVFRRIEKGIVESQSAIARDVQRSYSQLEALIQIAPLLELKSPLPPTRGWAISPDFARNLVACIQEKRPRLIVELGCGISTVVSAAILRRIGCGHIISIDHDELFAAETAGLLRRQGLSSLVSLITAPLQELKLDGCRSQWYSTGWLENIQDVDMVIVDGPPGLIGPEARFPALPILYPKLSRGAVLLVDDADRASDRRIIEKWRREFPSLQVSFLPTEKGMAKLTLNAQ